MTTQDIFTPTIDGGGKEAAPTPEMRFDEVTNWSVSLLFEVTDPGDAPAEEERRLRMLQALRGLSPMLTISERSIALTVSAVGSRDQAVSSGLEAAWTGLDAGGVSTARLVGVNLISNERVDTCVEHGLPFLYDTETDQARDHEAALSDIRGLTHPEQMSAEPKRSTVAPGDASSGNGPEGARPLLAILNGSCASQGSLPRPPSVDTTLLERLLSLMREICGQELDIEPSRRSRLERKATEVVYDHVMARDGIVNQKGAASVLGVSRQRAHQLLQTDKAPQPMTHLDGRPIWLRSQIEQFAIERHRRP